VFAAHFVSKHRGVGSAGVRALDSARIDSTAIRARGVAGDPAGDAEDREFRGGGAAALPHDGALAAPSVSVRVDPEKLPDVVIEAQ
jgi:hypothetical protein